MRFPQWVPARTDLPGLGLAAAVGACALGLARLLPHSPLVSDVLLALVLGALILNTPLRHLVGLALPAADREPDRYAPGLRYTGKWVLRLGIIAMGLKVQTSFFQGSELAVIGVVVAATIPSTFFVAHVLGPPAQVRRPLVDLLAGGTMICGASAVNAIAPVAKAHRSEQGVAIAVVFLFSVVALITFHPIATAIGLPAAYAGLWSGLAVNDLSSAIAVGSQFGATGETIAAAAKSARILLLAPVLVILSLMRREGGPISVKKSIVDAMPRFLFGYIALALLRIAGDRTFGSAPAWHSVIAADKFLVDFTMVTVTAGIGLHLALRSLLTSSPRALLVGGGTSFWMAGLTLAMLVVASRTGLANAALIGAAALVVCYGGYRFSTRVEVQRRLWVRRFESGAPLSLAEATHLLDEKDRAGTLDDDFLRRILVQLHPTIGELIPIRDSPLPHGAGCRWVTYWEGKSGWALVALSRDPGSTTPIHAHPHRLIGKAIEGVLEEMRFDEREAGNVELTSRVVLGHEELVETDAMRTIHVVRAVGAKAAIDLQLRGPEVGGAGRVLRPEQPVDLTTLAVGSLLRVHEEADVRPGHGGEGARAGRVSP